MKNMTKPIIAAPTAHGDRPLEGKKNILTDALYEMGYDETLVDTLIERNVIDFSTVNYTSDVMNDLIKHYGKSVLCGGLLDAIICEDLDTSLTGETGRNWRASNGSTFRERILRMIDAPIELLGLKAIEISKLKNRQRIPQLSTVKRNAVIDYGEFGMQLPNTDIIVYRPENSHIIATISSKISAKESIAQTGYWKSKFLENKNTAHIKVYLITTDTKKDLTKVEPAKKSRVLAEVELDSTYVLTTEALEESDKVKLFEHFIADLKKLIEEN